MHVPVLLMYSSGFKSASKAQGKQQLVSMLITSFTYNRARSRTSDTRDRCNFLKVFEIADGSA